MGIQQIPLPSGGITVADGNNAGWGNTGGETWTVLSNGDFNGSATYSFTGLSGYKTYKLVWQQHSTSTGNDRVIRFRLNNYSDGNYFWGIQGNYDNGFGNSMSFQDTHINLNHSGVYRSFGHLFIPNANLTGVKNTNFQLTGRNVNGNAIHTVMGFGGYLADTSPINRIDLFLSGGAIDAGKYTLYGGN